ncbi:ribonuclease PH [Mobiluncus curtisii]|uniref:ribonuclease PH n=1 Tax=Mobiluncus curtisii TaxID=2051 RepID=UPI00146FF154|nr:ribonuclease PH [Mobiluncus curtisii]NMW88078.1 ribonuclease PH [Mobiluncus curtisii]
MKRKAMIKKLQLEAKRYGREFEIKELTRHTAVRVGTETHTLGRHNEFDETTVRQFFAQYQSELGKGWWRK